MKTVTDSKNSAIGAVILASLGIFLSGTAQAQTAIGTGTETLRVSRQETAIRKAPAYFDGQLDLSPISGTALRYVTNSAEPVLKTPDGFWFTCEDGIWFTSATAFGPWQVATALPSDISRIPPEHPLAFLTKANLLEYDGTHVWLELSPGYYDGTSTDTGDIAALTADGTDAQPATAPTVASLSPTAPTPTTAPMSFTPTAEPVTTVNNYTLTVTPEPVYYYTSPGYYSYGVTALHFGTSLPWNGFFWSVGVGLPLWYDYWWRPYRPYRPYYPQPYVIHHRPPYRPVHRPPPSIIIRRPAVVHAHPASRPIGRPAVVRPIPPRAPIGRPVHPVRPVRPTAPTRPGIVRENRPYTAVHPVPVTRPLAPVHHNTPVRPVPSSRPVVPSSRPVAPSHSAPPAPISRPAPPPVSRPAPPPVSRPAPPPPRPVPSRPAPPPSRPTPTAPAPAPRPVAPAPSAPRSAPAPSPSKSSDSEKSNLPFRGGRGR